MLTEHLMSIPNTFTQISSCKKHMVCYHCPVMEISTSVYYSCDWWRRAAQAWHNKHQARGRGIKVINSEANQLARKIFYGKKLNSMEDS